MRVFVTGATGFVGSAVVRELIDAGHDVIGLARSDASADALAAAGAEPHRGDLTDLESLRSGASLSDGVIHTAFIHDFSKFAESCAVDRRAIEALGAVLAGSQRPLIVTSGTAMVSPGRLASEDAELEPGADAFPRVSEQAALAMVSAGVRASVVRLPPTVHGTGDHGFLATLIGIARDKGASAYVGEGLNRWPAVDRNDTGSLYRLVLEKGRPGARYHGVAEEGVPFRQIADVIGRRLNLPVVGKTPEEAAGHFGWFAGFAALDAPAASARTRQELGWAPTGTGLIADLDRAAYFEEA